MRDVVVYYYNNDIDDIRYRYPISMISVAVAADEARAAPHAVSSVALIASTCENNLIIYAYLRKNIYIAV